MGIPQQVKRQLDIDTGSRHGTTEGRGDKETLVW